ncbi:hypothetical protein NL480_27975, partial [Klebsiella pneumoniae]|nr:hypothetical protein [Klebsiella pneumoniae]
SDLIGEVNKRDEKYDDHNKFDKKQSLNNANSIKIEKKMLEKKGNNNKLDDKGINPLAQPTDDQTLSGADDKQQYADQNTGHQRPGILG